MELLALWLTGLVASVMGLALQLTRYLGLIQTVSASAMTRESASILAPGRVAGTVSPPGQAAGVVSALGYSAGVVSALGQDTGTSVQALDAGASLLQLHSLAHQFLLIDCGCSGLNTLCDLNTLCGCCALADLPSEQCSNGQSSQGPSTPKDPQLLLLPLLLLSSLLKLELVFCYRLPKPCSFYGRRFILCRRLEQCLQLLGPSARLGNK